MTWLHNRLVRKLKWREARLKQAQIIAEAPITEDEIMRDLKRWFTEQVDACARQLDELSRQKEALHAGIEELASDSASGSEARLKSCREKEARIEALLAQGRDLLASLRRELKKSAKDHASFP